MSRRLTHGQRAILNMLDGDVLIYCAATRTARSLAALGLVEEDDSGNLAPNFFRITEAGRIQLDIEKTKIENAS